MNQYTPNAVEFLQKIHPTSFRQIIRFAKPGYIESNEHRKPQQSLIVPPTEGGEGALIGFIDSSCNNYNLYYSLGVPHADHIGCHFKLAKNKLASSQWLHCDIDPDKDKPYVDEHRRIAQLIDSLDKHPTVPTPTAVVFSGGGYQCLWRLAEPVNFNKPDDYRLIEERNHWLADQLGGDAGTFNCDRILRLPGTVNYPDEKKQATGRTDTLAELHYFNEDRTYTLDDFDCLAIEQKPAPTSQSVTIGNAKFISQITELDAYGIDDWIKTLIVRGVPNFKGNAPLPMAKRKYGDDDDKYDNDPYRLIDDTLWQDSRSEGLFAAIRHLYQHNVPIDIIKGICLNDSFRISDHVYNQKSGAERYTDKQIKKIIGQMDTEDSPLNTPLNQDSEQYQQLHAQGYYSTDEAWQYLSRYFAIESFNGKSVVAYHNEHGELETISPAEFKNFRANKKVKVNKPNAQGEIQTKLVPLGDWWWLHKDRPSYNAVRFEPGVNLGQRIFNTWEGFAYTPADKDWSLFYQHLLFICDNNQQHLNYLLDWMATAVQYPNRAAGVAVVLKGVKGCGKTTVFELFGQLFGRHYHVANGAEDIVNRFNDSLRTCIVLLADEAFNAGDKANEGRLKNLITGNQLRYEAKHANATQGKNCLHIGISSNEDWVVPANGKERRYFVLNVRDTYVDNTAYFDAIRQQMDNGGYQGLLKHLMERPHIDQFFSTPAPTTSALMEQIVHSMSYHEQWWCDRLESDEVLPGLPWETVTQYGFPTRQAYEHYVNFVRRFRNITPMSNKAFITMLAKWFHTDQLTIRRPRVSKKLAETYRVCDPQITATSRIRLCDCPDLAKLQTIFSKQHGGLSLYFEPPVVDDQPHDDQPHNNTPFNQQYDEGNDAF